MKGFFKQYSYNIVKNFINQFAISIFGALLSMVTIVSSKTSNIWSIVVSIFSIVFYLFLIYTTTWEIGAKDRISVDVGKKQYKPLTGLLISLVSNIPNVIFAVILMVTDLALMIPMLSAPTTQFAASFANMLNGARLIFRAVTIIGLQGMYSGILMAINLPGGANLAHQWWMYFVIIIPALITSLIAYNTGFKNFRLIAPLFDKKKKNNK